MDKNTTYVDLNEYNELRDFKKAFERNDVILQYHAPYSRSYDIYTKDSFVKKVLETNNRLIKNETELQKRLKELNESKNQVEKLIEELHLENSVLEKKKEFFREKCQNSNSKTNLFKRFFKNCCLFK